VRRELQLAGLAVALTAATVIGALVVPGAVSEPRDEPVRPSDVDLRETTIAAGTVSGESVTLRLDSRLAHRGGRAQNVTVETRAIDADTGLVATSTQQSLGDVDGNREVRVRRNVTVERSGDYRIQTIVYVDGERVSAGGTTVQNVGALVPAYARSSVSFHEFENSRVPLRAIAYRIVEVENNRTSMNVTVYLTNTGDAPAGDLQLHLRARQADSNVIADQAMRTVGTIRPGRTETVTLELTVPDGYNYWLDGILQSDGVVVGTASAPANLDPQETLSPNETRRDVGFQSGDFEETAVPDAERERTEAPQTSGRSGPGFTALAALLALVATVLTLARRHP